MEFLNTAFIVCSRLDSSRIPNKPLQKINGIPVINHLVKRLSLTGIPTIIATPEGYPLIENTIHYYGYPDDPLKRMYEAAKENGIKTIIRVTHDKIFVDKDTVLRALNYFNFKKLDYLYSSDFTDGSSFEIISYKAIKKAAEKFSNVEFISYAVRCVADKKENYKLAREYRSQHRFLIDYPDDLKMVDSILVSLGNDCTLLDAIKFAKENKWIKKINKLPLITVYTCAYNASKFINKCMDSVCNQTNFSSLMEYIIIDDFSSDDSYVKVLKASKQFKNIKVIKNQENLGLAASSNIALKKATGKYIIRLDADDYFVPVNAIATLVDEIEKTSKDVIYPNNYYGSFDRVQSGSVCHHVGGALFRTKAINYIKFTDNLRNYEGLDLWKRAKDQLEIGYFDEPVFYYRQHAESMSHTNLEQRAQVYSQIMSGVGV